ncbi:hypothetical protein E2542_SST07795 [Spatholobus suberectus]|nr:hypothetical protein E2542_SST07795 [Spatholobus suberectus]
MLSGQTCRPDLQSNKSDFGPTSGETNSVVTAIGRKPPPAGDAPARDGSAALKVFQNKTNASFNSSNGIFGSSIRFSVLACESKEKGRKRWIENLDSLFVI